MGQSSDYPNVADWTSKPEGYQTGAMVKYQGNIFQAAFWASQPGQGDPDHNGWRLYDELYDVTTTQPPTSHARIIGYLPTWREADGFDFSNADLYRSITHGIIAFLMFDQNNLGQLDATSANNVVRLAPQIVTAAHLAGTTVSVALGGGTDYGFLNLMSAVGGNAGDARLEAAVQTVAKFVTDNGLDGVDLDLECWWDPNGDPAKDQGGRVKSTGPHPAGAALTLFARQLKAAMPGKVVSATLFATSWYGNNYDPALADQVDWLSIMSYDLTGSWNQSPVGPHTALKKIRNQDQYTAEQQGTWPISGRGPGSNGVSPQEDNPILSVEDALWYWSNPFFTNWQGPGQQLPRNKLVFGVPLYGYDFAYPKDPDAQSGQIPPGYRVVRYKDLVSQFAGSADVANANVKVPGSTPRPPFIQSAGSYPFADNIYFETPDSAVAKLAFVQQLGMQGVIVWEMSDDAMGSQSIVQALYQHSGNPATRPALPVPQFGVQSGDLNGQVGNDWTPELAPGFGTYGTPSVAVFNNTLYAFHEGWGSVLGQQGPLNQLWYTVFDDATQSWVPDANSGFGTSGSPALAVFDNKLIVVHEGSSGLLGNATVGSGQLWWAAFDGSKWSQADTNLAYGTTGPPALAVYAGKLFCVHRGFRGSALPGGVPEDPYLWWTTFDGNTWSADNPFHYGVTGTPSLAVFENKLYCVHEGGNSSGEFWYTVFDGNTWSEDTKMPYGTSGAPALAVLADKLHAYHEGSGRSGHLWRTALKAGEQFTDPNDTDTGYGITGSPGLAVLDKIYAVHQGRGQTGELWWFSAQDGDLSSDERLAGHATVASPNVAAYKGDLICVYEGLDSNAHAIAWSKLPLQSAVDAPWLSAQGSNGYQYHQLDSSRLANTMPGGSVATRQSITVTAGTPFLYAVLYSGDTGGFPSGANLLVYQPDGSTFTGEQDDANAFVLMSDSSIHTLVIANPMPGTYTAHLTVPANVTFSVELGTVASTDVAQTMADALGPLYPAQPLPPGGNPYNPFDASDHFSELVGRGLTWLGVVAMQTSNGNPIVNSTGNAQVLQAAIATVTGNQDKLPLYPAQSSVLDAAAVIESETPRPAPESKRASPNIRFFMTGPTGGAIRAFLNYRDFINAVREQLGGENFAVRVIFDEAIDEAKAMGWMLMRGADLYIINFRSTIASQDTDTVTLTWGTPLTETELRYPDYAPGRERYIGVVQLHEALLNAFNGNYGGSTLTTIAFVVAEGARFDLVRNTVDALLYHATIGFQRVEWDYFRAMLLDWSKLSQQLHQVNKFPGITVGEAMVYLFNAGNFGQAGAAITHYAMMLVYTLRRRGWLN